MSMNQYFAIKAIKETNFGASVEDIAAYHVPEPRKVIYQLRQKGHIIVTKMIDGNAYYFMPFGTRQEMAREAISRM